MGLMEFEFERRSIIKSNSGELRSKKIMIATTPKNHTVEDMRCQFRKNNATGKSS